MSDLRRLNTPPRRAGLIEAAAGCLKTLRACLDATTADRARACAADERGFGAGIKRRQIAAFELAWAAADALAAETAVRAIRPDARSLDVGPGLPFAADAIVTVSDRLESIRLEPGEAARAIPDLSRDAGFQMQRRAATRAAIRYTAGRKVFGASLQSYALTRAKLARTGARFAACRQLTCEVGRQVDGGERRMEAGLAKLLACRSAEFITREALQLHGGMGYAEETAVSRYFDQAREGQFREG